MHGFSVYHFDKRGQRNISKRINEIMKKNYKNLKQKTKTGMHGE